MSTGFLQVSARNDVTQKETIRGLERKVLDSIEALKLCFKTPTKSDERTEVYEIFMRALKEIGELRTLTDPEDDDDEAWDLLERAQGAALKTFQTYFSVEGRSPDEFLGKLVTYTKAAADLKI